MAYCMKCQHHDHKQFVANGAHTRKCPYKTHRCLFCLKIDYQRELGLKRQHRLRLKRLEKEAPATLDPSYDNLAIDNFINNPSLDVQTVARDIIERTFADKATLENVDQDAESEINILPLSLMESRIIYSSSASFKRSKLF